MNTPPEAEPGLSSTDPSPELTGFPWPPGEQDPIVAAFADTWKGAVLRPRQFFEAMPESLSLGAAVLYYLVIGVVAAAIQLFWTTLLPSDATLLQQVLGRSVESRPLVDFLASPLYLLLSLYLAAGVTHLLVLLLVPHQRGFGTTLRVFCFAYSPALFGVVPYLGSVVAFIWMTAASIIGVSAAQHTTRGRAAAAVLLPLFGAMVLLAIGSLLLTRAADLIGP